MVVTKSDLQTIESTDILTFTNGAGNRVDADLVNQNFATYLSFIQTLTQFSIDQSPQLGVESTFTVNTNFSNGLKTNTVTSYTTNGNLTLIPNGTGKLYKTSATTDNELYTKSQVDTAIASIVGTSFTLIDGGIKTTDFTVVTNTFYYVSGATGNVTATLPANPVNGQVVGFVNYLEDFIANGNVFNLVSANHNIQGGTATAIAPEVLDDFYSLYLIYDTSLGWYRL